MRARFTLITGDARELASVADNAAQLVVTSPPYPMIEMWDGLCAQLSPAAGAALAREDGPAAFQAVHQELDRVWAGCFRVLKPGGIAAINIGDATRTLAGEFALYSNHSRILQAATALGFTVLPDILWRKPTNAPNKFMGSGMLPGGAYVTYEHEYILILRKGGKRAFTGQEEKERRRQSAYFWEERNQWFSDLWVDLPGVGQGVQAARKRSAAFPFEVPWRLIQMYTAQGDAVLDPFLGTGTSMVAAMASGRHSHGVEIDPSLLPVVEEGLRDAVALGNDRTDRRLVAHTAFVAERRAGLAHHNAHYDQPVMTAQEAELSFLRPLQVTSPAQGRYRVEYDRAVTRRILG